jgi:hypothetical protein
MPGRGRLGATCTVPITPRTTRPRTFPLSLSFPPHLSIPHHTTPHHTIPSNTVQPFLGQSTSCLDYNPSWTFYCASLLLLLLLVMSPSPLPPEKSKTAKEPVLSVDVKGYREVVYHDGRGYFTADSRRRSRAVSWVESTSTPHHSFSKDLSDLSSRSSGTSDTSMGGCSPSLDASQTTAPPLGGRHVTCTKRAPKSRRKIIVEQKVPGEASKNILGLSRCCKTLQEPSRYYRAEIPTPPPTPRIKRLPTPELLDVEGRPFCDCSTQKYLVKHRMTCRQDFDPCSVYE